MYPNQPSFTGNSRALPQGLSPTPSEICSAKTPTAKYSKSFNAAFLKQQVERVTSYFDVHLPKSVNDKPQNASGDLRSPLPVNFILLETLKSVTEKTNKQKTLVRENQGLNVQGSLCHSLGLSFKC